MVSMITFPGSRTSHASWRSKKSFLASSYRLSPLLAASSLPIFPISLPVKQQYNRHEQGYTVLKIYMTYNKKDSHLINDQVLNTHIRSFHETKEPNQWKMLQNDFKYKKNKPDTSVWLISLVKKSKETNAISRSDPLMKDLEHNLFKD